MTVAQTTLAVATMAMTIGAASAGAVTFQVVVAGDCPGDTIITVVGAEADGVVDLFRGAIEGSGKIPVGPCAGSESGLESPQWVASLPTDAAGVFALTLALTGNVCGTLLQAVDTQTCAVGNVERLASGYPAPVPITGRTTGLATGDDGELQKGLAWPVPRFSDHGDGTIADNLTGLVWLQNTDCFGTVPWPQALSSAMNLADGQCGLADGSMPGDWRLPNLRSLQSLIDYEQDQPALPAGHPFQNVVSSGYWSSTTSASGSLEIWGVRMGTGEVGLSDDPTGNFVLPVRDR